MTAGADKYGLAVGDMLAFENDLYDHFAVYIGNGEIIHLTGECEAGISRRSQYVFSVSGRRYKKAVVKRDKLDPNMKLTVKNKDAKDRTPLSPRQIVANAKKKLGPIEYNILWNNCEHFAQWCRYGESKSDQVENLLIGIRLGALGIIAAGLVAGVILNMNDGDGDDEEETRRRRRRRIKQNYE